MLLALSIEEAQTAAARDLALQIRAQAPSDAAFATAVHRFVLDRVRFVREPGEVFTGASYTLAAGAGDCDDHARLAYALLRAGGLPARLAFLSKPGQSGPSHVLAQAYVDGAWRWLETTIPAAFGEHPYAAGMRLGLLRNRDDIAKEERFMDEKDLAPIPNGFEARVSGVVAQAAASALHKLGYLCDASIASPVDPAFRQALAGFQRDHSLTIDGLLGPQSMGELAREMGAGATAYLTDEFLRGVVKLADDFQTKGAKVSALDFLSVWQGESGIKASTIGIADDRYAGLNGMGPNERKATGFPGTRDEWVALTEAEQLPFVRRFYEMNVGSFAGGNYAALDSVGKLYLMNFTPAFLNKPSDFVIASPSVRPDWYTKNKGLDVEKKGWIEVGDMAKWIAMVKRQSASKLAELDRRLKSLGAVDPPPSSSGGTPAVNIAGAVVLVIAVGALGALAASALRT